MATEKVLAGEVALVTGASRGIGLAIAQVLGARGAYVVGTATTETGAERLTAALRDAGVTGHGAVLDVGHTEQAVALVAGLEQDGRPVSVLINNAGITRDGLLMRMKEEDWAAVLDTNLSSVFRMTRACLRNMMKVRRGRIISIGSVVGHSGNFGQTNYAASKAAVIGFTRSLAREVGSRGITVNAIAPGFIDTDMTRGLAEEQRQALLAQIPLARLGLPEEIAEAAAFLASPQAAYITGTVIHVNGGLYMG
ncbi:MAG TPA: 3-oxoacyl-ACP reductase FabG [Acidiferrobacteraceae bacterium]|nr:3-oxoacyl-ACP reductase FabG [Acidiferrobacteraceae bacterium]